jgi:hypothetical protein
MGQKWTAVKSMFIDKNETVAQNSKAAAWYYWLQRIRVCVVVVVVLNVLLIGSSSVPLIRLTEGY